MPEKDPCRDPVVCILCVARNSTLGRNLFIAGRLLPGWIYFNFHDGK